MIFLEPTSPAVKVRKRFELLTTGAYEKTSYPNMYRCTSHEFPCANIATLHELITAHAPMGFPWLKGPLTRPIVNESRAGLCDPHAPTQVFLADVDGLDIPGADLAAQITAFITSALPEQFHKAAYHYHPSASYRIAGNTKLSAHIAFMLDKPIPPAMLKHWVTQQNLTNPILKSALSLSKSGITLKYALDVTANQNDKLIFVAPPECVNFPDPLPHHRYVLERGAETVCSSFLGHLQPTQDLIDAEVNLLRKNLGLKARTAKYKNNVLLNPEAGVFTPSKHERGFVYGNINNGDSDAYYYPEDNPRLLYNFKGEPAVFLRDLDPEYYATLQRNNQKYLVFRDREEDTYYNGFYDPITERHDITPVSSKDRMSDFMRNYGLTIPDPIPDWTRHFSPQSPDVIDFPNRRINLYQETPILRAARHGTPATKCPPATASLVAHMLNYSDETMDDFMNWVAALIQTKTKLLTAWVIHGCQGTGKGMFFKLLMQKILGEQHCVLKSLKDLDDMFNSWAEQCLLCVFDEADITEVRNPERTMATLKNLITEPEQTIRKMRTNPRNLPNYSNFIFYSNQPTPIHLDAIDRRFHVAPKQLTPLPYTDELYNQILSEVDDFASYMLHYPVDLPRATKPKETAAKIAMRNDANTSIDSFFEALNAGDIVYFLNFYNDETQASPEASNALLRYKATVEAWCKTINTQSYATRSQIINAYNYLQAQKATSPNKFETMCGKYDLVYVSTKTGERAIRVTWHIDSTHADIYKTLLPKQGVLL